ncbi:hypothetical protein ACN9MN_17165 [Chryseobacterium sp. S-02]
MKTKIIYQNKYETRDHVKNSVFEYEYIDFSIEIN